MWDLKKMEFEIWLNDLNTFRQDFRFEYDI